MKIASVAEVKSQFSAFLKASEGGPVVVTRNGRPVSVIVGVQDEDEIERLLLAYSPHLRAILERMLGDNLIIGACHRFQCFLGQRRQERIPGMRVDNPAGNGDILLGLAINTVPQRGDYLPFELP